MRKAQQQRFVQVTHKGRCGELFAFFGDTVYQERKPVVVTQAMLQVVLMKIHQQSLPGCGILLSRPIGHQAVYLQRRELHRAIEGAIATVAEVNRLTAGPVGTIHPALRERMEVGSGLTIQYLYQLVPRGIAEAKATDVALDAPSEGLLSHQLHHATHHHGCFVVDDGVVNQSGIAQVVQWLTDAGAPLGAILRDSSGSVGLEPVEGMVDVGEERLRNFGSKVVGKHLLGPHIVKPVHCHGISKPHVSGLVGNQLSAAQLLVGRGMGRQEEGVVVVESGSGMLHATKLEAG